MTTLVLGASTNIQRYSNIAIKKIVLNKKTAAQGGSAKRTKTKKKEYV